ncbi:TetR/AcrR family transcriptional regulator [Lysinibacillus cavernae]|uniref:TetR/AcrR family transcriptional regulator n=1 Tax=Lysinibacillus cavernae TaxID=2666135 RepID=UPI0012D9D920|nr:TetR/AcrR family transcriptional regulator [Lysinibacillus cavernae]
MKDRKQVVIESTIQLFTEKGFQNTSVQDILDNANISKGTFYKYFSSKNECLTAVLEQNRQERNVLKEEILIGKKMNDIEVLVEQLTASLTVKEKYNLMPLFREIAFLNDEELQKILAYHRFHEIAWLKNRFFDIFGEVGKPYYYECAVIFFGLFQYLTFYWNFATNKMVDIKKSVWRSLMFVENLLPEMIKCGEVFLEPRYMNLLEIELEYKIVTKEMIQEKLGIFCEKIVVVEPQQKSVELATFLLEEVTMENPRISVLEIIIEPFRHSFLETRYKYEADEIANLFWLYIKMQNKA